MLNQEDLKKYEKQIEAFLSLKSKEDSDLFKSIQFCGEYIKACTTALNDYIREGDLERVEHENNELIRSTKNMKLYLYEAVKRAEAYLLSENCEPAKQQ
jgi:hypothetical protein